MDNSLIKRQDALDALGEEPLVWYDSEDEIAERNQWRSAVKAIKAVPSAQPYYTMRCSFCDMSICTLKDRPCSRKVVKENG